MDKCTYRILGNKRLDKSFSFWYNVIVAGKMEVRADEVSEPGSEKF